MSSEASEYRGVTVQQNSLCGMLGIRSLLYDLHEPKQNREARALLGI